MSSMCDRSGNKVGGPSASISGGDRYEASGIYSSVTGGEGSMVSGEEIAVSAKYASVSGRYQPSARASYDPEGWYYANGRT